MAGYFETVESALVTSLTEKLLPPGTELGAFRGVFSEPHDNHARVTPIYR